MGGASRAGSRTFGRAFGWEGWRAGVKPYLEGRLGLIQPRRHLRGKFFFPFFSKRVNYIFPGIYKELTGIIEKGGFLEIA